MAGRDRLFSGDDIYNEQWSKTTRDVFFYCLGVLSDNLGTFPIGVSVVSRAAVATQSQPRHVRLALQFLYRRRVLVPYQVDGEYFAVFRKWQDRQHISYHGNPTNPFPPERVFRKLSEKTRELFRKAFGGSCPAFAFAVATATADAVAVARARAREASSLNSPGEGGNGKDPTGKPTAADLDHIRRLKADPERWKLLSRATQRRYEATLEAAEAGP